MRRRRLVTTGVSGAAHAALVAALLLAHPDPQRAPEPPVLTVSLVDLPPPAPLPAPAPQPAPAPAPAPKPAPPTPAKAKPKPARALRKLARRAPPSPDVAPVPSGEGASADTGVELSEADLAGAAVAGEGGGGGGACDMAARLQAALRKDPLVHAALAEAGAASRSGRPAILVWNGDWVRHPGQDGNGLAAVREAIMWEVAFAPLPCRTEPVHGLVLLSLNGSGSARLVVGEDHWRWSDLLGGEVGRRVMLR